MDGKELVKIGTALYGPRWKSKLARAIGVSHMSVRKWELGINAMPIWAALAIRALAHAKKDPAFALVLHRGSQREAYVS